MAVERTLTIIKPDATSRNITGKINTYFEEAGLRIVAQKRVRLTREQAEAFYAVHAERSFYDALCEYMCSGPVVAQVLEGEDAVSSSRAIMGARTRKPVHPRSRDASPAWSSIGCSIHSAAGTATNSAPTATRSARHSTESSS